MLRNLLQNAVKASPENESIQFSIHENMMAILNKGDQFSKIDFEEAVRQSKTDKTLHGPGLKLIAELSETGLHVTYAEAATGIFICTFAFNIDAILESFRNSNVT